MVELLLPKVAVMKWFPAVRPDTAIEALPVASSATVSRGIDTGVAPWKLTL
jgi:hypothetical protein